MIDFIIGILVLGAWLLVCFAVVAIIGGAAGYLITKEREAD